MASANYLAVLLPFVAIISLVQCEYIQTPTGIQIPINAIHAVLPQELHHEAHNHIYDVNQNGDVIGPNGFSLPLSRLSSDEHVPIKVHSTFHATLNGYPFNHLDRNTTKTNMGEYTAVHTGQNKKLLGLWGPTLHLSPINHAKHPFTFVNSFRQVYGEELVEAEAPPIEFGDDSVVPDDHAESNNMEISTGDTTQSCASGTIHYIEVYAAFDNVFCSLFGDDERSAISVIQASFDIAMEPYLNTCARPTLIGIEAHCNDPNDPYSSLVGATSSDILLNFRNAFTANNPNLHRDNVQFFSGSPTPGGTIGRAYLGRLCPDLTDASFGWTERVNPYTLAHEMGHNFNMYHTGFESDTERRGLMGQSGLSRTEFFFIPSSIQNLTAFLDNNVPIDSSCVTTTQPQCDSTCPNTNGNQCIDEKCVANTAPTAPNVIPCVPASHYDCAGKTYVSATGFFYTKTDCPAGYNFVPRTYDANDPTIICCNPSTNSVTVDAVDTQFTYIRDPFTSNGVNVTDRIVLASNHSIATTTFMNTQQVACDLAPSVTPSVTASITTSPTSTVSAPVSISTSPSSSASNSPSASASFSTSFTASISASITPSLSTSITPSTSQLISMSSTPSSSISSSTESSMSPSISPSIPVTESATPSSTVPESASASMPASVPPPTSPTITSSMSASPSISASTYSSVSSSPSATKSLNAPSTSSSQSTSSSATTSLNAPSPSSSSFPSSSPSATTSLNAPSPSSSSSPSSSPSATPSSSPSATTSLNALPSSSSPSSSSSGTMAPSASVTPSSPVSQTPSETTSQNAPSSSPSVSSSSIPSITVSVSTTASPSSSILATSSVSISSTSSATFSRTPSPTASKSTAVGQAVVCGDTLQNKRHLSCKTRKKVKLAVKRVGKVRAIVSVRFGRFYFALKGLKRKKIRGIGFLASTSSSLRRNQVIRSMTMFRARRIVSGRYNRQIESLPLTLPRTSCCGNGGVKVYIAVRLCNRSGFRCATSAYRISMKMRCGRICGRFTDASKAIPMGPAQRCPRC